MELHLGVRLLIVCIALAFVFIPMLWHQAEGT
jgi:hypothetical protein